MTPEGWGEVLAEFEHGGPPFKEGDRLTLPDSSEVMVIGTTDKIYRDRWEQTIHVGNVPAPVE
jgi:hypothetical protein